MNKKLLILGIAVLLICVGLSGCTEEAKDTDGDGYVDDVDAFPNDIKEWLDSDGDGVGDNSDDFPDNANECLDSDNDGYGDNSDAFPNDSGEWLDSDSDGYGDNSDDYPTDSNFHKKTTIVSGSCFLNGKAQWDFMEEKTGMGYNYGRYEYECTGGTGKQIYIESDVKFVVCDWYVQKIVNGIYEYVTWFKTYDFYGRPLKERIAFVVYNPSDINDILYDYEPSSNVRIPITAENWGDWHSLGFMYENINYNALVTFEIYTIK